MSMKKRFGDSVSTITFAPSKIQPSSEVLNSVKFKNLKRNEAIQFWF